MSIFIILIVFMHLSAELVGQLSGHVATDVQPGPHILQKTASTVSTLEENILLDDGTVVSNVQGSQRK